MTSTRPLTDAIGALTTYANSITEASDTTLSEAVATLAEGYGKGGIGFDEIAGRSFGGEVNIQNCNFDIATYAFSGSNITKVNITFTTSNKKINAQAFSSCSLLQDVFFNYCSLSGAYAFSSCGVKKLHIEGFLGGQYSFASCSNLTTVVLTDCHNSNWSTGTFRYCSNLSKADMGNVGKFGVQCFQGSKLDDLVLRRTDAITALNNINAFAGMKQKNITVYVPQSLLTTYQNDSLWSTVSEATLTFTAIEGSQYENYYVDGTPIE